MEKYLDILRHLIQFESVNDGEHEVAEYIAGLFKNVAGAESTIVPSYPGRSNVIVKIKGKAPGKVFAFSGHLDVVAPGEGWCYPPFEGVVKDNKMYGRGTSDMKAGVAAALYALLEIAASGVDFSGELWFIGTVGEEVGMQGAKDLVNGHYLDAVDGILIPEPTKRETENQAIFASKGSIMYTVHAQGKTAHSSMPELGINAIMTAADFVQRVQGAFDEVSADPNYHNDNLGNTLNVFSMIEGGLQFNSVPGETTICGNIRTVPEFGSGPSIKILEDAIEDNNQDKKKAHLSLELNQVLDAAEAKRDSALIQALILSAPNKNIAVRPLIGTCELSRYIHLPKEVDLVVYGPGLTQVAHIIDEYIELDEYVETIDIFKKTALAYLQA